MYVGRIAHCFGGQNRGRVDVGINSHVDSFLAWSVLKAKQCELLRSVHVYNSIVYSQHVCLRTQHVLPNMLGTLQPFGLRRAQGVEKKLMAPLSLAFEQL